MEIHAEAESDDGGLQQKFGELLAFGVEGVGEGQAIDESAEQGEWGRNETAGGKDECDEKDPFLHMKSLGWRGQLGPSSSFNWR